MPTWWQTRVLPTSVNEVCICFYRGEILPAEATVIEVIGGSKAIIVLTKAADNEGLWPQLFAPQQVRIASEATTDFGEFERNSEDLDVRLKSLNYDWNEDPKVSLCSDRILDSSLMFCLFSVSRREWKGCTSTFAFAVLH